MTDGLETWRVSDHLRKRGALDALRIAKLLGRKHRKEAA